MASTSSRKCFIGCQPPLQEARPRREDYPTSLPDGNGRHGQRRLPEPAGSWLHPPALPLCRCVHHAGRPSWGCWEALRPWCPRLQGCEQYSHPRHARGRARVRGKGPYTVRPPWRGGHLLKAQEPDAEAGLPDPSPSGMVHPGLARVRVRARERGAADRAPAWPVEASGRPVDASAGPRPLIRLVPLQALRRASGGLSAVPRDVPRDGTPRPSPVRLPYREHNGGRIVARTGHPATGAGCVTHNFTQRKGYAAPQWLHLPYPLATLATAFGS